MWVTAPLDELLHLALQGEGLPPFVTSAELVGSLLRAEVDVRDLPGLAGAARLAARAVGTVHLDVALAGYRDGVAHLAVEAHARSVPAHRLAALFTGPLDAVLARTLADRGLPPGLTTVDESGGVLTVAVRVQDALDAAPLPPFLRGAVVDDLTLADSQVAVALTLPA